VALLVQNGVIEENRRRAGVLNRPTNDIAWLASRLGRRARHLSRVSRSHWVERSACHCILTGGKIWTWI
jgi:hypothetical protein